MRRFSLPVDNLYNNNNNNDYTKVTIGILFDSCCLNLCFAVSLSKPVCSAVSRLYILLLLAALLAFHRAGKGDLLAMRVDVAPID